MARHGHLRRDDQRPTASRSAWGSIKSGAGWRLRSDGRYSDPTPIADRLVANDAFVVDKLKACKVDSEWETMAAEIAEDVRQGKMEGPYRGPSHWPKNTVNLPDFERTSRLLDLPTRQRACSFAFAVRQTGSDGKPKIRRAEDWRQSGANATVQVPDSPTYHSIDALVQLARALRMVAPRDQLQTWGLDPENTRRQLPAADPCHACVILPTRHGIALWRRRALLFGLTASVWSCCRTANLASWFGRDLPASSPALRRRLWSDEVECTTDSGFQEWTITGDPGCQDHSRPRQRHRGADA